MTILHDPENGQYGDCMRATIASILELESNEVPHFYENGDDKDFDKSKCDFLASLGLVEMTLNYPELFEYKSYTLNGLTGIYHLMSGYTERKTYHSVVGCDGVMVHDPHPSKSGLMKCESFSFLIVNK